MAIGGALQGAPRLGARSEARVSPRPARGSGRRLPCTQLGAHVCAVAQTCTSLGADVRVAPVLGFARRSRAWSAALRRIPVLSAREPAARHRLHSVERRADHDGDGDRGLPPRPTAALAAFSSQVAKAWCVCPPLPPQRSRRHNRALTDSAVAGSFNIKIFVVIQNNNDGSKRELFACGSQRGAHCARAPYAAPPE